MKNINKFYTNSTTVTEIDCMDDNAIWPHNISITVCRIPIRKRDDYSVEKMQKFAQKLKYNMANNGIVFLICYAPTEAKARPFEVAQSMVDVGFHHIDNIIIQKSWLPGKRSDVNLVNSHDYVMYFCNGKVWKLDRAPILNYLKKDEDVPCPGNTWTVETGSLYESISPDLALLLLQLTDLLPGSTIFDPFMGNTSTLKATIQQGHHFYGFEKDNKKFKQYEKIAKKEEEVRQCIM